MRNLDDEIAANLKLAAASGELQSAKDYGRPIEENDGYFETPEALRMPFRILKNAGVAPLEVEMFRRRRELLEAIAGCKDATERAALQVEHDDLSLKLAMRLENLRATGEL